MIRCRSCNFKTEDDEFYKHSGAYASSGIYRRIRNYEHLWGKATETRDEYPSVPYRCCKQLKLPDEEKLMKLQVALRI